MSDLKVPKDCKFFLNCSSSLCPLDIEVKEKVWCPEENDFDETCRNPEFAKLRFIRTQKKIAKISRKQKKDRDDYFTFEMLNRNIVVRGAIKGISEPKETVKDHEEWYQVKERKWILKHPELKGLSKEQVDKIVSRLKSAREEVKA